MRSPGRPRRPGCARGAPLAPLCPTQNSRDRGGARSAPRVVGAKRASGRFLRPEIPNVDHLSTKGPAGFERRSTTARRHNDDASARHPPRRAPAARVRPRCSAPNRVRPNPCRPGGAARPRGAPNPRSRTSNTPRSSATSRISVRAETHRPDAPTPRAFEPDTRPRAPRVARAPPPAARYDPRRARRVPSTAPARRVQRIFFEIPT